MPRPPKIQDPFSKTSKYLAEDPTSGPDDFIVKAEDPLSESDNSNYQAEDPLCETVRKNDNNLVLGVIEKEPLKNDVSRTTGSSKLVYYSESEDSLDDFNIFGREFMDTSHIPAHEHEISTMIKINDIEDDQSKAKNLSVTASQDSQIPKETVPFLEYEFVVAQNSPSLSRSSKIQDPVSKSSKDLAEDPTYEPGDSNDQAEDPLVKTDDYIDLLGHYDSIDNSPTGPVNMMEDVDDENLAGAEGEKKCSKWCKFHCETKFNNQDRLKIQAAFKQLKYHQQLEWLARFCKLIKKGGTPNKGDMRQRISFSLPLDDMTHQVCRPFFLATIYKKQGSEKMIWTALKKSKNGGVSPTLRGHYQRPQDRKEQAREYMMKYNPHPSHYKRPVNMMEDVDDDNLPGAEGEKKCSKWCKFHCETKFNNQDRLKNQAAFKQLTYHQQLEWLACFCKLVKKGGTPNKGDMRQRISFSLPLDDMTHQVCRPFFLATIYKKQGSEKMIWTALKKSKNGGVSPTLRGHYQRPQDRKEQARELYFIQWEGPYHLV